MTKLQLPSWTHKCPCCGIVVRSSKIYCPACIKTEPSRTRFRLARKQRWIRDTPLPYISKTLNHLFISTHNNTMCAECGRKLNSDDLQHKCFFRSDASLRSKNTISCSLCKQSKQKALYPLVRQGSVLVRVRICVDCLEGSRLVVVSKRKYVRRTV